MNSQNRNYDSSKVTSLRLLLVSSDWIQSTVDAYPVTCRQLLFSLIEFTLSDWMDFVDCRFWETSASPGVCLSTFDLPSTNDFSVVRYAYKWHWRQPNHRFVDISEVIKISVKLGSCFINLVIYFVFVVGGHNMTSIVLQFKTEIDFVHRLIFNFRRVANAGLLLRF